MSIAVMLVLAAVNVLMLTTVLLILWVVRRQARRLATIAHESQKLMDKAVQETDPEFHAQGEHAHA